MSVSCLHKKNGPVIAVSDYVKLVAEQVAPYIECPFVALGTDGFGRSGTRSELRNFFEINCFYIVMTALDSLYKAGNIDSSKVQESITKYNLNPEKTNPLKV